MDTNESTCPICLEALSDKTIGSPDICDHKFCLACLEKWAKHGNFCPVDKQKFRNIISDNEVIQVKFKRKKKGKDLYDISVHCEICKDAKEGNDTVILCDSCDLAFHLDCLDPPLKSIPAGNWDCPDCLEVLRKRKLKSQKTKDGKKAHKASTNSKWGSSSHHSGLIAPTKQIGINKVSSQRDKNECLKFQKTKHSSFPETDYCQEKYSCNEKVNSPDNCTETLPGEFEDFFNISDDKIVLTQRKLLKTKKSFSKNFGNEFRTNVDLFRNNTSNNTSKTLQTERKTKRLAAEIASNKIYKNLKKNTEDSSEQLSVSENNSLGDAASFPLSHFADIKKGVLSHHSSVFPYNNKIATNYKEEFSLYKSKSISEIGFEGKRALMENLNKIAASGSKCETLTTTNVISLDSVGTDSLFTSETDSSKVGSTNTKVNDSQVANLKNARIQAVSESFKLMNVRNCFDKFSLNQPKSVNRMDLHSTLIENSNKNAASKSSIGDSWENSPTLSSLIPINLVTEDLDRNEFPCASETASWKVFPTSTEVYNSEAENLNGSPTYMLKSLNNKNITNYLDKFSLSKSKSVNEMGLESTERKTTLMKNLNGNEASKSFSTNCENFATFTYKKSPNLSVSETAGCAVTPLKIKVNGSLAVVLNRNEIHKELKSLNFSQEPDTISNGSKPLQVKETLPYKRTRKESSEDSRVFRNMKLGPTETRTKRLAAANARKKLTESFKSSSEESSSDESSVSSDQHKISKDDNLENLPLKFNNHYSFKNFEKALSNRNSSHLIKHAEDSKSEFISDSGSSENIKEKNTVMEDLDRRTSPIPKDSPCITEDFNGSECLSAASEEIKNSVAEEPNNVQIHLESESSSIPEKPEIVYPPELVLEPFMTPLKLGENNPPDLLIEPLKVLRNHGNKMLPIAKENKMEQTSSIVDNLEKGSLSSSFSVIEKATDSSGSAEKQPIKNQTSNGITRSHIEGSSNANNLQNHVLSQEKINSSDIEVTGEENILDTFHIRQVHYAIKAKMNLPSELQKIEQETWLSRRSKSSRKFKYKSSRNEALLRTSSSHHQIVSENEQLYNFFQSSQLDCNKSSNIKKDVEECNKFNPFCESVSSTHPRKHFKVTEYRLKPSDKLFRFNKIPKNVLQSFMGPYGSEHLDMHEDGSLFLNWAKSKSC